MTTAVRRLAAAATLGMFVVLLMGATVTNTGSGEGCGRSWPLCHGEFVPAYAFETMVEYSHRLVTGVEGLIIAATAIGAWRTRRRLPILRVLVPLMIVTLLLQSGMGAAAVRSPQSPPVLALHFGISLACFAAVFLTWRVLSEGAARFPRASERAAPPPVPDRLLAWSALVAVTGVAYLGAYLRHSDASFACATWPLCNGALFPGLTGPEGANFGHRLAALAASLLVALLALRAWRARAARPDLAQSALVALALILVQALSGAALVFSRLALGSTLAHAALMALLFVVLADLCRRTLPQPGAIPLEVAGPIHASTPGRLAAPR